MSLFIAIGDSKKSSPTKPIPKPDEPLNNWDGLRMVALENSTIDYQHYQGTNTGVDTLYYTLDGIIWKEWDKLIELKKGEQIGFIGNRSGKFSYNNTPILSDFEKNPRFFINGSVELKGNIFSLISKSFKTRSYNNYTGVSAAFSGLFLNCEGIKYANNLIMPQTYIDTAFYSGMFYGCKNMITCPSFTISMENDRNIMAYMFYGCSSLIDASNIVDASQGTNGGYNGRLYMFMKCTSLKKGMIHKHNTLYNHLAQMYDGCTSLTEIRYESYKTVSYTNWTRNVSPTGKFYIKSGTEYVIGVNGIPEGWEIIEI